MVPRSWRLNRANAATLPRRSATSDPVGRVRSSPCHGSQRSNTWWTIPVPRVSVRNSVRNPISPRAGTRYSIRTQPVPWLTMCSIRPLRTARSCVTTPTYSSGTSTLIRSTGSHTLPSISRVTTCGLPTVSSKPSRRISSTRMASASSPRPWTSHTSGRSVSVIRSDTLPTSSRSSRALSWLAVSLSPSWPASGEVFIPIVTDSDGSSTVITGSGRGSLASASVSPIVISGIPATEMISPASAEAASTRSSASVTYSSVTLTGSIRPSARHQATVSPRRIAP